MDVELVTKGLAALPTLLNAAEAIGRIVHEYKLESLLQDLNKASALVRSAQTSDELGAGLHAMADVVNRMRNSKPPG